MVLLALIKVPEKSLFWAADRERLRQQMRVENNLKVISIGYIGPKDIIQIESNL